jgi:hypothetical protein
MSRRRNHLQEDIALPWQAELGFALIGLICVPFAMWWFINEITAPAQFFSEMLGAPVDLHIVVESGKPLIWIFGLIVGWRVRCWIRRQVLHRISRTL